MSMKFVAYYLTAMAYAFAGNWLIRKGNGDLPIEMWGNRQYILATAIVLLLPALWLPIHILWYGKEIPKLWKDK